MLRAVIEDNPEEWPDKIPAVLADYRMTLHRVTGISPNLAMLGLEVICPAILIAATPDQLVFFQLNIPQQHAKGTPTRKNCNPDHC